MTTSATECRSGLCGGSGFVRVTGPDYIDPISGYSIPSLSGTYVACSCRLYTTGVVVRTDEDDKTEG